MFILFIFFGISTRGAGLRIYFYFFIPAPLLGTFYSIDTYVCAVFKNHRLYASTVFNDEYIVKAGLSVMHNLKLKLPELNLT